MTLEVTGSTVERLLPDFLILGAAKSGTTWLAHNLGVHPEVELPEREIHFFSRHWNRGEGWYEAQLPPRRSQEVRVGERSNTYLYHPEAPRRIAAVAPAVRLIALLRHPVDRAYSDYCMHYARRGSAVGMEVLDPASAAAGSFVAQGMYGRLLGEFLEVFPREQLRILFHDDLATSSDKMLRDCLEWVGVPRAPRSTPTTNRNARPRSRRPRLLTRLDRALEGTLLHRIVGASRIGRLVDALSPRATYPPLDPDLEKRLQEHYLGDMECLEEISGRDLSRWKARFGA